MALVLLTVLGGLAILIGSFKIFKWRHNFKIARSTGLPTFYSPIHFYKDVWWMAAHPILIPILDRLPTKWTAPWLQISKTWEVWKNGHLPFETAGNDTFILATPSGNILWSSDLSLVHQILNLHPKTEQPVEVLDFWNIWGPTIGSVQGEEWKAHRRTITSSFGPAINRQVWEEAKQQTASLIKHWVTHEDSTVPVVRTWTSRLALHVLAAVFFNLRLGWDHERSAKELPVGHKLPFYKAVTYMLEHLLTIYITPRSLLSLLPGKVFREAYAGFTETSQYFKELQNATSNDIEEVLLKKKKTLLEAIVLSASDPKITGKVPLREGSVMGNIFFTIFAGHETVGGGLGFILLLLAVHPELQRRVQEHLDIQLGERCPSQWTLDEDFRALQNGFVGAVQKEVLYLYNPAVMLSRRTVEAVTLHQSNGSAHLIPEGTMTFVNIPATARNPAQWTHKPKVSHEDSIALSDSPALYFNPDRWLGKIAEDLPSSYPFGAGGRSCPGKTFAEVEMTAVMAALFKSDTLELKVSDDLIHYCGGDKIEAWQKTRKSAIKMLYEDIGANMSIHLRKELPIQIVPRQRQSQKS